MSRIVFLKMDEEDQVEVRMSGDLTWDVIADRFGSFLQACGYQVSTEDLAQYYADINGLEIFTPTTEEAPNTITVSNASYDFQPLTSAMKNWNP